MTKQNNNVKKQKRKWRQLFKNKTFIKWCKYNSIILILGTSLILNIIYIPKVFNGTTSENNNVTNIEIQVINGSKTVLENNYVTTFNTLGNLLSACPNDFTIEKNQFGRFLVAVKNITDPKKFWQIKYWNDGKFIPSPVGIDDIKLKNNDIFQFELIEFSTIL